MVTILMMSLALFAAGGHAQGIDGFDYADQEAARKAWVEAEGTAPVVVAEWEGRRCVQVQIPFKQSSVLGRVVIDRTVELDLSSTSDFRLTVDASLPEAIGNVTLYFRSGDGWYGCGESLVKRGHQTLRFDKVDFRSEGSPTGWHKIGGIRLAFWRGGEQDAQVRLLSLDAMHYTVAIVVPSVNVEHKGDLGDTRTTIETARRLGDMLREAGLGADTVPEDALVRGVLKDKQIAILPLSGAVGPEAAQSLVRFVEEGGKIFACYGVPPALASVLGIGSTRYIKPDEEGRFASIHFDSSGIPGLPASVAQRSWNIQVPEALQPEARVIGRWFDGKGRPTGQPALIVNPAGVYMSHIVLADDWQAKKNMLIALLGWLEPSLWRQMADDAINEAFHIGPSEKETELIAFIEARNQPDARKRLAEAQQLLSNARSCVTKEEFANAVEQAREAHLVAADAYLKSVPSRDVEARGFWEHSGLGAYPGDWERTARELASSGFNMVVPNMLWGGLAHYASDLLPRSESFTKYGDQVAACVEAAHRHDLEVHVWKVNHNLGSATRGFVSQLRQQDRLQESATGEPLDWLCPSHPDNFQLEVDSMLEVVRKYAVDGLHFDYIRYPDADHCFCQGCRKRFEQASKQLVGNWPHDCHRGKFAPEYRKWRCDQITRLVARVSQQARSLRPDIKISAAVFSGYPDCRDSVGQDWVSWVEAGYLDFVCPMDYTASDFHFKSMVSAQLASVGQRIPLYPGIGATSSRSRLTADRVAGQIEAARAAGTQGFMIFNLDGQTISEIAPGIGLGAASRKASLPHQK